MPIITLTTEWKPGDIYNGIIKGMLCRFSPSSVIIDNASSIPPYNLAHASFVIRNTFASYPQGTIHVICIHTEAGIDQHHLIVKARGHYFIGTDNGIFNLILNAEPEEIVRLDPGESTSELEIFARAAAGLAGGKKPEEMGTIAESLIERMPLRATIEKDAITGSIIFIDSYGNAISNITREVFSRVFDENGFTICIRSKSNCVDSISQRYSDVSPSDMLARFNDLDLLEIAINGDNVSELLSIEYGAPVRIERKAVTHEKDKLF